ncbi:ABC transporter ATP-binding protein [Actinomadura fulvescens]
MGRPSTLPVGENGGAGATSGDVVSLVSVTRTYGSRDNKVTALAGLSVGFPAGRFTAIMGPSGSGKSTLLQCAAGLDRPDEGKVIVGGTDLTELSEAKLTLMRRDRIGFVFQSFNLLASLTAEQNVGLPMRLAGRRPKQAEIAEVLDAVGLADRARHRPSQLSGGQQQRVAIARAIVTRPEVLFADEPTGALDTSTSRDVLEILRDLADQYGQTIIMVTHDPVAASHADRVVFLADGRLVGEMHQPTAEAAAARMARLETGPC